ncbi:MAG: cation-translocating P-type ATPase [Kiritimatiellae bacterium]|nr:cation-translocating P-type ATPase [Kiritimatiellia bacterium]
MNDEANEKSVREILTVKLGIKQGAEEEAMRSGLSEIPGIRQVEISRFEGTVSVEFNPQVIHRQEVEELIRQPGRLLNRLDEGGGRRWAASYGAYLVFAVALVLALVSLTMAHTGGGQSGITPLYWVVNGALVLLGFSNFYRAFRNLFSKSEVNAELLITITTLSAMAMNLWTEAALMSFMAIMAHALRKAVVHFTTRSSPLNALLGARVALVRSGDDFLEVPVSEVQTGQTVLLRQGMMIPVDGKIISGMGEVLESGLTGESSFRIKEQGDEVYAGCVVQYGTFEMLAEKVGANVSLAYLEKLIHYAATRKTKRQRTVDTVAKICMYILVPGVVFVAILYGQFTGWDNRDWLVPSIHLALTAMIALSPFALILATPLAVYAGILKAARRGVVFKSGDVLERMKSISSLLVDKTGTLTCAQPVVSTIQPFVGHTVDEVLKIAVMIEQKSNHPIAKAVMRRGQEQGIKADPADRFLEFEGGGACAIKEGEHYKIGSLWLMQDGRPIPDAARAWMEAQQMSGLTPVLVGDKRRIIGGISFEDEVREGAAETLRLLKKQGIRRMVMVTGDNKRVAERLARQLEMDDVLAECMPSDKLAQLTRERSQGYVPGMVGDGINDAPALAAADVGIAMGAVGNDVAIQAADVALLTNDIRSLYEAVRIGRQIVKTIDFNIFMVLAVDAMMLLFAFLHWSTLEETIMAQMAVVFIVILSSLYIYARKV